MMTEARRVLLADDEETFRRATARLLEQEGYQCDCAQDAHEAGQLLTTQHDALISDVRMPGNMQFEFLRDIRARFPTLPIVLVTGYPSVHTAVESLRLSFADYLLKPVDWPELRQAVAKAVEKGHSLRAVRRGLDEAVGLHNTLTNMEQLLTAPGAGTDESRMQWTLQQYIAQSATQMTVLSTNIQQTLAGIAGASSAPTDICEFMHCPRQTAYKQAVLDTIEVLERTKHAFKSKDLGELRRKLEALLKEATA